MNIAYSRQCVIRTPEGISFSMDLAGPATRFLAWIVDCGVVIVGTNLFLMLFNIFALISPDMVVGIMMLILAFNRLVYSIALEWLWRGQTIGKFVLGIRVVDAQGFQLTFSQVVLRNLLRFVDALPVLYLFGGISLIFNARAQRLGDLVANSIVIRRRKPEQPDLDQILPGKYNSFRAYPHIEARLRHHASPEHAALLVQALLRREELEPNARIACYREIADAFREMAAFPEEATVGLSDEQYLRNVVECLYSTPKNRVESK